MFSFRLPFRASTTLVPLVLSMATSQVISCDSGKEGGGEVKGPNLDNLGKTASAVSFGSVCGFCSGYVLKKIGRGAASVFGVLFITFQTASYVGYVKVDWEKLEKDSTKLFDLNKDGVVDNKDMTIGSNMVMDVLLNETGSALTGFGGGFVLGVRKG